MKVLTTIPLRGSHKPLRVGSIRSSAALPRVSVRGRAFFSEQTDDNRIRYYKGGQRRMRRAHASLFLFQQITSDTEQRVGTLRFAHPTFARWRSVQKHVGKVPTSTGPTFLFSEFKKTTQGTICGANFALP